jgi:hypothetical protein
MRTRRKAPFIHRAFLFSIAAVWILSAAAFSQAQSSDKKTPRDINGYLKNHVRTDVGGEGLWLPQLDDKLTKWLDTEPGFVGKVYYVHATNLTGLFKYEFSINDQILQPQVMAHEWTPAYAKTRYRLTDANNHSAFEIEETKFINNAEEAFSIVEVLNTTSQQQSLAIRLLDLLKGDERNDRQRPDGTIRHIRFKPTTYYFTDLTIEKDYLLQADNFIRTSDKTIKRAINLKPNAKLRFTARMIFGNRADDCEAKLANTPHGAELLSHTTQFNKWFADNVPAFSCSDLAFEKMYYYRWYLLKKCAIQARRFILNHPYMDRVLYEGVAGRWFTKVIGLPLPLQIMEARWLNDKSYATSQARVAITKPDFFDYLNWTPYAIWQLHLVAPNKSLIKEALPVMQNFVATEAAKDEDGDALPTVWGSWITGMEYQPSFHYFTSPRWDHTKGDEFVTDDQLTKDAAVYKKFLPLERVDEATYYFLNNLAIAKSSMLTGDSATSKDYQQRAANIRLAVLEKMWDKQKEFFYDLNPTTDEKAIGAKMADGFFPFLFGELADKTQSSVFKHLLNPQEFWTKWPVPSASQDCPAFDSHGFWKVGPKASAENPYQYVCNWNGPTWLFSNALILDSLGSAAQMSDDENLRIAFMELFKRHTRIQFLKQDFSLPCAVEHYDSRTGENIRLLADYFHSSYNDLLIRFVIGIKPREDDLIEIAPLANPPMSFTIRDIRYRHHKISMNFNRIISISIDGKTIFHRPFLKRILYNPKTGKLE